MSSKHLPTNLKLQVASNLLKQAPPGEFNHLVSDVRVLLNDDVKLCEEAKKLSVTHNINNFIPVQLKEHKVLITRHNDLGDGRFLDPESRVSFKFNHLTKEASDFKDVPKGDEEDEIAELWRSTFHRSLEDYVKSHYSTGVCNVFTKTLTGEKSFAACIEAHIYNPSALLNGIWRSEWTFLLKPPNTRVSGYIMLEASYYEHGTVHLSASQPFDETLHIEDMSEAAKELTEIVEKADNKIQAILMEEYNSYSGTTLKSMRRQLPLTCSFLDWNKLLKSRIMENNINSPSM